MYEKIYLDMDGVLADFDRGVEELCNFNIQKRNSTNKKDDDLMWKEIRKIHHFYYKLKPMRGMISLVRDLYREYGDKVEILTGIPKPKRGVETAAEDKKKWVEDYINAELSGINPKASGKIKVNICYKEDKPQYIGKGNPKDYVLIDDTRANIDAWSAAGGSGILYENNNSYIRKRFLTKPISGDRRAYMLLEYLRENSDESHPLSQKQIQKYMNEKAEEGGGKALFKSLNTVRSAIVELAEAANTEIFDGESYGDMKNPKDWRIVYDSLKRDYSFMFDELDDESFYETDKMPDDFDEDNDCDEKKSVRNIYYNHPFSTDELDRLIQAVQLSNAIDDADSRILIDKLKTNLASKYYRKSSVDAKSYITVDKEMSGRLKNNLIMIQNAIDKKCRIFIKFNAIDEKKCLKNVLEWELSPYDILIRQGKYYLYGYYERKGYITTLRIDLLSDIEILENSSITAKSKVKGAVREWNVREMMARPHMTYDEAKEIKLRLRYKMNAENGDEKYLGFLILSDVFGDEWRYIKDDPKDSDYCFVSLRCSMWAMERFALENFDRIEVLEPLDLRKKIKKTAKELGDKYKKLQ